MAKKKIGQGKGGGVIARSALYAYTSQFTKEAIDFEVEVMRNKDVQMAVRISAANKIIDKCLPDLKAMELTGEDQGPLRIQIIEEKFKLDE